MKSLNGHQSDRKREIKFEDMNSAVLVTKANKNS